MASKKRVVLDLNAKVKVVEASEKDKRTVKQTVGKSEIGKTQVYEWLTGNGSMKNEIKTAGNENINETVWDWFDSTTARKMRL
jgi:hypothetical protein